MHTQGLCTENLYRYAEGAIFFCMYRIIYTQCVCVQIFVVHLFILQRSPGGVHICVYHVLNYAQILLMHAYALKCISMFVQQTSYGVCLRAKKSSMQMCLKGRGNMCMCAVASAPQRFTPPLSRPSAESPKSQMATAHRLAHTDTHTEQDAELSWGQSQQMSWSELACCVF